MQQGSNLHFYLVLAVLGGVMQRMYVDTYHYSVLAHTTLLSPHSNFTVLTQTVPPTPKTAIEETS